MRHVGRHAAALFLGLFYATFASAQTAQPMNPAPTAVERVFRISGVVPPTERKAEALVEDVSFSIYAEETGGTPLWQETQSVAVDKQGRYSVLLGSTSVDGLPLELFATGEPRWLGKQVQRPEETATAEQPRTLLTSVPYALKAAIAADAATLGGRPATDYQLTGGATRGSEGGIGSANGAGRSETFVRPLTLGTIGAIGKFVTSIDLGDSTMFESSGKIGVGTTSPLDIVHARFTDTTGGLTGIAVQNLGSTATSYSGMLFYDHTGALGQFQGFNNSTKEYRINNVAAGGTINFMLGGTSQFRVNSSGTVDVNGTTTITSAGDVRLNGGDFKPLGTGSNGVRWVDAGGLIQAHIHRFGAVDNRLYVTNAGSGNLTGVYLASGATSWTSTSDERLKTDITPVTGILDKIKRIRVVAFNMASLSVDKSTGRPAVNRDIRARTMKDGTEIKQQIGSIAQDWIADFPELVVEPDTDDQYYGLDYDRIGVVALGGVKELGNLVAQKDAEIRALNARLTALERRLTALLSSPTP
jgi:Chaperone of endosialidase